MAEVWVVKSFSVRQSQARPRDSGEDISCHCGRWCSSLGSMQVIVVGRGLGSAPLSPASNAKELPKPADSIEQLFRAGRKSNYAC
jgi:hypothetical protein